MLKEQLEKLPQSSSKPVDRAVMVKNKSKKGAFVHRHFVKSKFDELPDEVR